MSLLKIAVFASGSGTNAENIIKYFENSALCRVVLVLSNKNNAYVLERAKRVGIETFIFSADQLNESTLLDELLEERGIDFLILAGFLLKIPQRLLDKYPSRIINIHPALLPSYGGKGMYGMKVHQAVIEAGEKKSGITIHLVDEHYDSGNILFQARCIISKYDTPEDLAKKIHLLEYRHYPAVIEKYLMNTLK